MKCSEKMIKNNKKVTKTARLTTFLLLTTCSFFSLAAEVPDFASYKDVKQKKAAFFDYMYPLIVTENKKVLVERNKLEQEDKNSAAVKQLCEKYSKNCETITQEKMNELLLRVNLIPPSLALAQSANESAWGTSRFATKAHNYFGQWCFSKGCGLVPLRRNAGTNHEVRKFASPQQSVGSYIFNLNTGRVYGDIRSKRAELFTIGKNPSGYQLATGLSKYSERGQEYVKEIQSMISYNKLVEKYDEKFWNEVKGSSGK